VTVLDPPEARKRVKQLAQQICRHYE
jgi:hypothetical protein